MIKRLVDDADELLSQVVSVELLDVHEACIVFDGEPSSPLAYLGTSYIAGVASWHLFTGAIVLPKAIFTESLGQMHINQPSVCLIAQRYGRIEQRLCVNDIKERDTFLPDLDHCVIKGSYIFLSFL